jgi:hypothetical protein
MLAEQLWSSLPVLLIFFIGGIAGEMAGFIWQSIGAGNSVANFAPADSILVACFLSRPGKLLLFITILVLGTYSLLIVLHDIHGIAAAGVYLALLLGFILQRSSGQ